MYSSLEPASAAALVKQRDRAESLRLRTLMSTTSRTPVDWLNRLTRAGAAPRFRRPGARVTRYVAPVVTVKNPDTIGNKTANLNPATTHRHIRRYLELTRINQIKTTRPDSSINEALFREKFPCITNKKHCFLNNDSAIFVANQNCQYSLHVYFSCRNPIPLPRKSRPPC